MIKQQQEQVFVEENMSNLTTSASGELSVSSGNNNRGEPNNSLYNHQQYYSHKNQSDDQDQPHQPPPKKKRNLPGNPDPDAEVIALSPKTLLATNRFVCEICNKGFQRDQNLQLHRRGHNLPWKLKQRTNKEVRKKVYVCPETSCVHHDPSRALGDLTGIKKHFCRKHGEKKWKCEKCSKRYAVQSDWKAHSKVCGTREYRCDCGTLFSRRDSFITHRAFCDALAEETARAITTNTVIPDSSVAVGGPSNSHFINLQQQFNNTTQQDPLHAFPLKREQHQHPNLINLPPWLSCQQTTTTLDSPSSSSSIFHQDQLMQSSDTTTPQQQSPNPSMGPSMSFIPGPYHTQTQPHMSATALLQKAAQMGATMSPTTAQQQPHNGRVSDTCSNPPTTTNTTTTAGLFGFNLSSHDPHHHHILSSLGNKAATPTTTTPPTTPIGGSDPNPSPSSGPNPSSFLHDMMINSLTDASSYDNHPFAAFHQTLGGHSKTNGGGGGGGNEGLTRDFLGLRPLSQSDILTIAGYGNCMSTNTTSSHGNHQDTH